MSYLDTVGVEGMTVAPMSTIDATRKLACVTLDGVRVDRDRLLGGGSTPARTIDDLVDQRDEQSVDG